MHLRFSSSEWVEEEEIVVEEDIRRLIWGFGVREPELIVPVGEGESYVGWALDIDGPPSVHRGFSRNRKVLRTI